MTPDQNIFIIEMEHIYVFSMHFILQTCKNISRIKSRRARHFKIKEEESDSKIKKNIVVLIINNPQCYLESLSSFILSRINYSWMERNEFDFSFNIFLWGAWDRRSASMLTFIYSPLGGQRQVSGGFRPVVYQTIRFTSISHMSLKLFHLWNISLDLFKTSTRFLFYKQHFYKQR